MKRCDGVSHERCGRNLKEGGSEKGNKGINNRQNKKETMEEAGRKERGGSEK